MKKINTNRQTFLQLGAALALILVFLSAAAAAHAPAAEAGFNATRIADWLSDDVEFLMESETNRRFLQAQNGGKMIGYGSLNPKQPFCDPKVYSSCIGPNAKVYTDRKCDNKNLCKRPGQ